VAALLPPPSPPFALPFDLPHKLPRYEHQCGRRLLFNCAEDVLVGDMKIQGDFPTANTNPSSRRWVG